MPFPPTEIDESYEGFDFGEVARLVYPHATGRRLARVLEVNPRLAQLWVAGELEPTHRAINHVIQQQTILLNLDVQPTLQTLVDKWIAEGLDREAIGAQLALMHEKVVDRPIE